MTCLWSARARVFEVKTLKSVRVEPADTASTAELTTSIVAAASAVKLPSSSIRSSLGWIVTVVRFLNNVESLLGYDAGTISHEPGNEVLARCEGQRAAVELPIMSLQFLTDSNPAKTLANATFPPG